MRKPTKAPEKKRQLIRSSTFKTSSASLVSVHADTMRAARVAATAIDWQVLPVIKKPHRTKPMTETVYFMAPEHWRGEVSTELVCDTLPQP